MVSFFFLFFSFADGVPRLDVTSAKGGYHGIVDEDKLLVDVTPKIRAVGAAICAFRIVNKHHGETPFEVQLKYFSFNLSKH